ncbi:MAG: hypothetical protein JNL42_00900 [Anaerolineae bacterium]|nr:hypothetical protein [Anaerolineae bacterium]
MGNPLRLALGLLFCAAFTTTHDVRAQAETCGVLFEQALTSAAANCESMSRNEVCYGNVQIIAQPQTDAADFVFDAPGDVAQLGAIRTLSLSARLEEAQEWGIALMKIQANIPDALPGQSVTLLAFGDVEVENAVETDAEPPENTEAANPMQAFFFETSLQGSQCTAAPDSGLLVQTPDGVESVSFTANDVQISLGSTAFLQAQSSGEMTVSVVEGQAEVTAQGVTVVTPAGSFVRIPLDEERHASGPPSQPEPYDPVRMALLPIRLLPRAIVIAPPLDGSAESLAEGGTVPAAGEYLWVNGTPSAEGCPAGALTFVLPALTPAGPFRLSGEAFDLIVLVNAAFGDPLPPSAVSSRPEPGTYIVEFTDAGGVGRHEVRVINSTSLEGTFGYTAQGCAIQVPFTVTRVGD